MKGLFKMRAILIVLSLAAGRLYADWTFVRQFEVTGTSLQMSNQIVVKVKGERHRIETLPGQILIYDGETDRQIILIPSQKMYLTQTASDRKQAIEAGRRISGVSPDDLKIDGKLIPTGASRVISGFKTFEYIWERPSRVDHYWLCPTFPNFRAALKEEEQSFRRRWAEWGETQPNADDFPGMPIRKESEYISVHSKSEPGIGSGRESHPRTLQTTVITLVSAQKEKLSDLEFLIPTGYSSAEALGAISK